MCWVVFSYFNDVCVEYVECLNSVLLWLEGLCVYFICGGVEVNDDVVKIVWLVICWFKVLIVYWLYYGSIFGVSVMMGVDCWCDLFLVLLGMVKFFVLYLYCSLFYMLELVEEIWCVFDYLVCVFLYEGV